MTQDIADKKTEKTVLVVFPSMFSANKLDYLISSISKILKIKDQNFTSIQKKDSIIIVEASDPVLASSAISLLFGIDRIAIANEVENNFDAVLAAITKTSMNLLLSGEKFLVRVEGSSKDYLPKDLEVAATSSLVEKSVSIQASAGTESHHNRLFYTYLAGSHAYVCIFIDKGLGGVPFNSQREKMICPIYDELSAISCLQTIKMGFGTEIVVGYSSDTDLLKIAKMLNRLLPLLVQESTKIQFCALPKNSDVTTKAVIMTNVLISIATSKKIRNLSLPILPFLFPSKFIEENVTAVFKAKLVPWLPLSGMDSSIIENSKEIGLEKFLANLETMARTKFGKRTVPRTKIQKSVKGILKNIKTIQVKVGPKNVHDILDSLRIND